MDTILYPHTNLYPTLYIYYTCLYIVRICLNVYVLHRNVNKYIYIYHNAYAETLCMYIYMYMICIYIYIYTRTCLYSSWSPKYWGKIHPFQGELRGQPLRQWWHLQILFRCMVKHVQTGLVAVPRDLFQGQKSTGKLIFPTCQVRVVRFYQSCSPPPPRLAVLLLVLVLLLLF